MTDVCLTAKGVYLGHTSLRSGKFSLACADLNLEILDEEFIAIVGPSGCGKTTFLEALAGLTTISGGELSLHGEPIVGPGTNRSLVFQRPSLFPWLTVMDNVLFGLTAKGSITKADRARAKDLLAVVGMLPHAQKFPHELSGGMQQRVNLARALFTDPTLLLLDEPFSAVDAQTRGTLQQELLKIWQTKGVSGGKTAAFVTHDVAEAVLLADRVVVFSPGPAQIAKIFTIDAPRPRGPEWSRDPAFLRYCDEILAVLHNSSPPSPGAE